jgi:SAM-dependent methyltransferase
MDRGGMAYYQNLKCLETGDAQYEKEFTTALTEMNAPMLPVQNQTVLEIGAGLGMYCPWLQRLGYTYAALEIDSLAAGWIVVNRQVPVFNQTFESYLVEKHLPVDLLVAAHVIEHFNHAPNMIQGIYDSIVPGGRALLLIPDDQDKTNPNHLWFFTPNDFQRIVERVGFVDVRISVRRIMPQERFIYCSAWKPKVG